MRKREPLCQQCQYLLPGLISWYLVLLHHEMRIVEDSGVLVRKLWAYLWHFTGIHLPGIIIISGCGHLAGRGGALLAMA